MEPAAFLAAAERQLQALGVDCALAVRERRTFRVKDKQVVGFEVVVDGLEAVFVPAAAGGWTWRAAAHGVWRLRPRTEGAGAMSRRVGTAAWAATASGPTARFDRLLAKSATDVHDVHTLPGHAAMVAAAAVELLRHRGEASLRAAGLDGRERAALERVVLLAAAVHDLGKANDHFQEMVRYQRQDRPQLLRHEALTLFLCWPGQPLADWLRKAVVDDAEYVTALVAAAGHHRVFDSHAVAAVNAGAGSRSTIFATHPDFAATLTVVAGGLGIESPPALVEDVVVESTWRVDPHRPQASSEGPPSTCR